MKRSLITALLALATACNPSVGHDTPQPVVTAQFDPAQSPPVVPTPNDLAMDPTTGKLNIPLSANASAADQEFAAYLNTLNGYPADTPAMAGFSGALDPTSITASSVRVFDLTAQTPLALTPGYQPKPVKISVGPPATGWTAGHQYLVAIIGGSGGLRGGSQEVVAGSSTWALLRSKASLVTCTDLSSPTCEATTDLIPSTQIDPVLRLADQTAKALQLEPLRLAFKPLLDFLEAQGIARADVALAWSFHVAELSTVVFQPTATPPQVPVPNDLAIDPTTGLVNAPIDPTSSPAMQEFTADYLNHLNGFPTAAHASAAIAGPPIDPATVGLNSVLVADSTVPGTVTDATIAYDAKTQTIVISPPTGGWTKGHRYVVIILGGTTGLSAVASDIWALARSKATLVTCDDLTSPDCAPTLTLAPMTAAQAVQLETLRRSLAPLLDGLEGAGITRADVLVAWTFLIVDMPELTFDPANGVIPFPNNLLMANGKVNLPPGSADPALLAALNTLDGFSTTAPIVSENGLATGALSKGSIDPASLATGVGFINLNPAGSQPVVKACVDCVNSNSPDGGLPAPQPQTLAFVPTVPLEEKSTYGVYVSTAVTDTDGHQVAPASAFALLRLSQPLIDANKKSTLPDVADEDANKLEPGRQALKPLIDGLVAMGLKRSDIGLAWAFTTQTAWSQLPQIHEVPTKLGQLPAAQALPDVPDFAVDKTTTAFAQMDAKGIPHTAISKIFAGELPTAFLLTGPSGTMDPSKPTYQSIPFVLAIPTAPAGANGYPVVYFNHGITRNRLDVLAIANSLASAGLAVMSTDVVWHGERTTCAGARALIPAGTPCPYPAAVCDAVAACGGAAGSAVCDEATGKCIAAPGGATRDACDKASTGGLPPDAYCQSKGEGSCVATDSKCQAADLKRDAGGAPVLSGWNFIDPSNLFGTRDNFRQPVADLAQVYRVVASSAGTCLSNQIKAQGVAAGLDGTSFHFIGQSLGGILGTLYTSAAPEVGHVVLNVPGGDLPIILLTSPGLKQISDLLIAGLAQQGIIQGTPAFDQFVVTAKWILDPADPLNAATQVMNSSIAPAGRAGLLQYITGDQVIPNPTTLELIQSADRPGVTKPLYYYEFDGSSLAPGDRHGFLLNGSALTAAAQQQAVLFLATGTKPTGAQP